MFRKVDFVRRMGVAAVRNLNDGLEFMWFRNFSRGFEVFTFCVKVENLARIVGSHCFNFYGCGSWHGTRLLVLVVEKEPEARRHIGFKDGDFNKAVTEVYEEAIVWSVFDFPTVIRVSGKKLSMAVAFIANVPNHMVEAESHHTSARNPRKPAANLAAQLDSAPSDQTVGSDEQDKSATCQYYPVCFLHVSTQVTIRRSIGGFCGAAPPESLCRPPPESWRRSPRLRADDQRRPALERPTTATEKAPTRYGTFVHFLVSSSQTESAARSPLSTTSKARSEVPSATR